MFPKSEHTPGIEALPHTVFVLARGRILWSAASAFRRFALGAEMRAVGLSRPGRWVRPLRSSPPRCLCSVQGAVRPAEQSPTLLTTRFRVILWLSGGGCTAPRREACRVCLGGGCFTHCP